MFPVLGTSVSWRSRVISHPLDILDEYIDKWIEHLQEPTPSGIFRCPFAKKVKEEKRLKFRKVYDYHSAYDYWNAVSEVAQEFDDSCDVHIVVAHTNYDIINPGNMGGSVDAMNSFLNTMGKDLWVVPKMDNLFTIVMVQKITVLDNGSRKLEEQGYYKNRYCKQQMDMMVHGRRKFRKRIDGM